VSSDFVIVADMLPCFAIMSLPFQGQSGERITTSQCRNVSSRVNLIVFSSNCRWNGIRLD